MNWLIYVVVFGIVCGILFLLIKLWIGAVDFLANFFRKLFGIKQKTDHTNWHSLEEIRERNKEEIRKG